MLSWSSSGEAYTRPWTSRGCCDDHGCGLQEIQDFGNMTVEVCAAGGSHGAHAHNGSHSATRFHSVTGSCYHLP